MRTFLDKMVRRALSTLGRWTGRNKPLEKLLRNAQALAAAEAPHPALVAMAARGVPFISVVVPVYNTPVRYLDDLLASFLAQTIAGRSDGLFELILSDDGSTSPETINRLRHLEKAAPVKVQWNATNGGIAAATNAGIRIARGDWVALLDHDDVIAPFALERIARALVDQPTCMFLYTDEVIADGDMKPEGVFLKPAWDPVLLSGVNYVNHFSVYRRARLVEKGLLNDGFQGSQDYELLTRYTHGLRADEVFHLPYPAYHWRRDGASYSVTFLEAATANARKALARVYSSVSPPPEVKPALDQNLHRIDFAGARQNWPRVSVVIPSRDSLGLIRTVMEGLLNGTDYPDVEIIVVDNGTTDPAVLELYDLWTSGPVPFRFEIRPEPFNFSRAINRGVSLSTGDILLVLNNDIEVLEPGWLKEMVSCFDFPDVGVVGAKLLYPDRTLQHAGVIAGLGDLAGHWFIGSARNFPGPMSRLMVRNSMSVVTGACMAIRRACWDDVGSFDEEHFKIAYNDVDFCLRAVKAGHRVIWTPFAELVHHESATRGSDETPENIDRFNREKANLKRLHATDRFEDPAFNPWFSRNSSAPAFRALDALPPARSGTLLRRNPEG